jgi:cytochrome c
MYNYPKKDIKMRVFIVSIFVILFAGCQSSSTQSNSLDGQMLTNNKCASCHNLDMPPTTSEDEKAPPLFTVTVHLKDWIKVNNPSELKGKFVTFVKDYVINPSRDKSYCDKKSLDSYGLMPSQKGKVTPQELEAIANYIFDRYDQKALLTYMQERARIAALPLHEQVLETHDCKACHINGKAAPTFAQIGERYKNGEINKIIESIKNGSKGKWSGYVLPMRGYKDISQKKLEAIAKWIIKEAKSAKK